MLTQESKRTLQPHAITLPLKDHQLAGLYAMIHLDQNCGHGQINSNIGIFADLPGYGKTLTCLALVETLKNELMNSMPITKVYMPSDYGYTRTIHRKIKFIKTTLIVVPDNIVKNWVKHIDEWTELHYELVDETNYDRIIVKYCEIILCPAKFYNKFMTENAGIIWNRVIFDEPDSIYIPNTEYATARFLWLITPTTDLPKRKNKGFLKSLLDKTVDYSPITIQCEEEFIKASFKLPEPIIKTVYCHNASESTSTIDFVSPEIVDMINAGDYNKALIALGSDVVNKNVIDIVTRNVNNEIKIVQADINITSELDMPDHQREERIKLLNSRLESLETRKQSLTERISGNICGICEETLQEITFIECCAGIFCGKCLIHWLRDNNNCPRCRGGLTIQMVKTIGERKDKINTVIDIIGKSEQCLIFSEYDQTFTDLQHKLAENNIEYSLIKNFDFTPSKVILLNTTVGAGLDLHTATDVIIFHKMGKKTEQQAIARAQRPGRQGQLRVWYLRYPHEI